MFQDDNPAKYLSCILAVFHLAIVGLSPFLVCFYLLRNRKSLIENDEIRERVSPLIESVRVERPIHLMYIVIFMIRRLVFTLATLYLNDYPFI